MMQSPLYAVERLLYRRQFVLGPHFVESLTSWKRATIGDVYSLQVHPDLELTQVRMGSKELTLLGFVLDPDNPGYSNTDICNNLLAATGKPEDVFRHTARLGGRWIIIFDDGHATILFSDPCGLRTVFYTDSSFSDLWCASQPEILRSVLDLQIDEEAKRDFIESPYFSSIREPWWPAGSSPYQGIRQLIPNHFLDLRTKETARFWPHDRRGSLSLEAGVEQASDLLRRLLISARARYKLAITITAGLDSRMVLAASRDIAPTVYYWTLVHEKMTPYSPDRVIPPKLLSRLGLAHHTIECDWNPSKDFLDIYRRNVPTANPSWSASAAAVYRHYPADHVCVKGNGGEIARWIYFQERRPDKTDTETITLMTHKGNAFAARYIETWFNNTIDISSTYDYDILDLLYWEQRMGSWQAMNQTESDIVQEAFVPFNCRNLLTTLLAVDLEYRLKPNNVLFIKMIERLWKDTLSLPINGLPLISRLQSKTWTFSRVLKNNLLPLKV